MRLFFAIRRRFWPTLAELREELRLAEETHNLIVDTGAFHATLKLERRIQKLQIRIADKEELKTNPKESTFSG